MFPLYHFHTSSSAKCWRRTFNIFESPKHRNNKELTILIYSSNNKSQPCCGTDMSIHQKKPNDKEGYLRAAHRENLRGLRYSKVFFRNVIKHRGKAMLVPNRNRLPVLTGFVSGYCHLGKHMPRIGLQQNNNCMFWRWKIKVQNTWLQTAPYSQKLWIEKACSETIRPVFGKKVKF